ncbi:MAG: YetF domain-containing protein [Tepidiformaceae bacterium]
MDFGIGNMVHDMFTLGVPVWERIARAILVYFFVVIALRLAGKREIGALNPFDLVVLLFLSNILQNSIIGNDLSITGGLIGAATLLLLNYAVQRFLFDHQALDRVLEGEATVLIEDGKILHENLKKELVTEDVLIVAVHKQGLLDIADVEKAVLETDGNISVFARTPTTDAQRHMEMSVKLDRIEATLARLSESLPRAG